MAERHEEKYLIDYRQYALLKARAGQVLTPDPHGQNGSYTITSLYYDDLKNTALLEKQDGLAVHTKFRLRTYDANADLIRLERKVKQGIMTQKQSAVILKDQLAFLGMPGWDLTQLSEDAQPLALQMLSGGMRPATAIRYRRDAFLFPGTDLRLTFDTGLEVLPPDTGSLFETDRVGIPVLDGNTVIMEIKYNTHLPAFVRQLTAISAQALSVSKYALCREKFI